jgi:RNase P/RNase MRP subunit p30
MDIIGFSVVAGVFMICSFFDQFHSRLNTTEGNLQILEDENNDVESDSDGEGESEFDSDTCTDTDTDTEIDEENIKDKLNELEEKLNLLTVLSKKIEQLEISVQNLKDIIQNPHVSTSPILVERTNVNSMKNFWDNITPT